MIIRKFYEYEGFGGGIDPKSSVKSEMTHTMTKEQILENRFNDLKKRFGSIIGEFSEANKYDGYEWVYDAMQDFAKQEVDNALHAERNKLQGRFSELSLEVAAERERAGKLVEFAERLLHLHACEQEGMSSGKPSFADWITATNNLQHEIDQYKETLNDYDTATKES
jgi:hypothetical protein